MPPRIIISQDRALSEDRNRHLARLLFPIQKRSEAVEAFITGVVDDMGRAAMPRGKSSAERLLEHPADPRLANLY